MRMTVTFHGDYNKTTTMENILDALGPYIIVPYDNISLQELENLYLKPYLRLTGFRRFVVNVKYSGDLRSQIDVKVDGR